MRSILVVATGCVLNFAAVMSDRSDHLIERAAALLRAAKAGHVVDGKSETSERAGLISASDDSFGAGATSPFASRAPTHIALPQPILLPPGSGPVKATSGSVSDLRAVAKHVPVGIAALEQAGLMVARTNRTRTTEEYRIVIGRILRTMHASIETMNLGSEASSNVVMVTSARPGEGKSFTSLNLGGSIAQNAGESVLVVDVDAKRGSLSDTLGLSGHKGFLDLVANPELSPDDFIVPSELPNLSFLPLGSRSIADDSSAGMGLEERLLASPIKRLAQRFQRSLILLDAPPCLSTSDPHTLGPSVGQVVIVVEAERTQRSEVEAAIEMIRMCPTITMLLNKVRLNSSHTFGSYDYFGSYS